MFPSCGDLVGAGLCSYRTPPKGFPYEGKLSLEATDDVDSVT